MPDSTLISGPYGSERVPVLDATDPLTKPGIAIPDAGKRVPFDDLHMRNEPGISAARAARTEREFRPDANVLEAAGAAIQSWDTTRLIKRLGRPTFDEDQPINAFEYLNEVPMQLNEDEREYFIDVAHGAKSAQWALGQIQDRRRAQSVVGDHPVVGMATAFVDPLWLAVPPGIRLGKAAPVAGRVVSAVSAAAIGGAVTAYGEGPSSDDEIALSMVMNGALGGLLYREGKLVPADPEFPKAQLDRVLHEAEGIPTASPVYGDAGSPHAKVPHEAAQPPVDNLSRPPVQPGWEGKTPISYAGGAENREYNPGEVSNNERVVHLNDVSELPQHSDSVRRGYATIDQDAKAVYLASEALLAEGVAGNRYSTGRTRGSSNPSSNYVVFSDSGVDIAARYSKPSAAATQAEVVAAMDKAIDTDAKSRGLAANLMWNMHKTMSNFGEVGRKVADILYDNNRDLSLTSLEAHRESILSELRTPQYKYETLLRNAMAEDGFGTAKMVNPFSSREAYAKQLNLEREVQREMFRREQLTREGVQAIPMDSSVVSPRVKAMADALDELHAQALKELKSGGVKGAAELETKPGYVTRKWSSHAMDQAMDKMVLNGLSREAAQSKLYGLTSLALRRANGFDKKLSDQIGKAIVDRTLRKGYFEDALFNAPAGEGQLKEMRDILKGGGLSHQDIERALDVMRVHSDDAGKAGFLKHRMDIDYKATLQIGNDKMSIMDLIDNRMSTIVDNYVQQIGTQAAFARKGFATRSEIEALREELLHSVPVEQRGQAKDLFDNTIAHFRGDPAGARINENFRLMQSYGRSVSLAWSGLWQLTEFSTMMAQYGLGKTLRYAAQEIPGFKAMMNPSRAEASSLNNVLSEHSSASMRLRPYLAKFEDGFTMDTGSALQLAAQTQGQLVPYANAMRYVHHYQAKIVGNLIVDRLEKAAAGDQAARKALAGYGLESHVMDTLAQEMKQHGLNVDAWSDKVWEATRPAFAKMMDESVLRGRLGDVPAFAAFDTLGKFVFTYRTFVLTAHNKVLTGMAERNGAGAVGLVLMYQLPLALAAVQAQSVIMGNGPLEGKKLLAKAAGQMGGLGLLSEPLKWATGESNSVGAPALIPFDRGVKLFQAGAHLDPQQGASTAITMLPVVSASPFIKAIEGQIKK